MPSGDVLRLLGEFTFEFQELESELQDLIGGLISPRAEIGSAILVGIRPQGLLGLFERIIHLRVIWDDHEDSEDSPSIEARFKELKRRISSIVEERNGFVHSQWRPHSLKEAGATRMKQKPSNVHGSDLDRHDYTLSDLQEAVARVRATRLDLRRFSNVVRDRLVGQSEWDEEAQALVEGWPPDREVEQ